MADYRSGSSVNYAARQDTLIPAPAGVQDDDFLLALFEIGGNPAPPPVTPIPDFVSLAGFPLTRSDQNGFTVQTYAWGKLAAGEAGDYQVLHANAPSTAFMLAALGVDVLQPIGPAPTTQTGLGTVATAPGLITQVDQSLIVYFCNRWNFPGITPPGGVTPVLTLRNDADNSLMYVATGVLALAGATGDKVATDLPQTAQEPWASGLISIRAAAVVAAIQAAYGRGDGSGT